MSADVDLHAGGPEPGYVLRLYVAGQTPRSLRAVEAVRRVCRDRLSERHDLRVIDLYREPELASSAQVVAAPTLVKLAPPPVRRVVGDMSDTDRLHRALGIAAV